MVVVLLGETLSPSNKILPDNKEIVEDDIKLDKHWTSRSVVNSCLNKFDQPSLCIKSIIPSEIVHRTSSVTLFLISNFFSAFLVPLIPAILVNSRTLKNYKKQDRQSREAAALMVICHPETYITIRTVLCYLIVPLCLMITGDQPDTSQSTNAIYPWTFPTEAGCNGEGPLKLPSPLHQVPPGAMNRVEWPRYCFCPWTEARIFCPGTEAPIWALFQERRIKILLSRDRSADTLLEPIVRRFEEPPQRTAALHRDTQHQPTRWSTVLTKYTWKWCVLCSVYLVFGIEVKSGCCEDEEEDDTGGGGESKRKKKRGWGRKKKKKRGWGRQKRKRWKTRTETLKTTGGSREEVHAVCRVVQGASAAPGFPAPASSAARGAAGAGPARAYGRSGLDSTIVGKGDSDSKKSDSDSKKGDSGDRGKGKGKASSDDSAESMQKNDSDSARPVNTVTTIDRRTPLFEIKLMPPGTPIAIEFKTSEQDGVFAVRAIPAHTEIFREAPLINGGPTWLGREAGLNCLSPEKLAAAEQLQGICHCGTNDCKRDDCMKETPLMGVWKSNCIKATWDPKPHDGVEDFIYANGSKINHACIPNCSWAFTPESHLSIRTKRDVAKGEHITVNYGYEGSLMSRQRRISSRLKFVCVCDACLRMVHVPLTCRAANEEHTRILNAEPSTITVLGLESPAEAAKSKEIREWAEQIQQYATSEQERLASLYLSLTRSGIRRLKHTEYYRPDPVETWFRTVLMKHVRENNKYDLDDFILEHYLQEVVKSFTAKITPHLFPGFLNE
ncbi:hypothetical protein NHQ30_000870 [Ciborinia camelliae]|nr:hypothetical protein NHQ30_000870 [Ciborinia camelliae]